MEQREKREKPPPTDQEEFPTCASRFKGEKEEKNFLFLYKDLPTIRDGDLENKVKEKEERQREKRKPKPHMHARTEPSR